MRYVIYGANRVAKDFLYMFDQIEPLCFAEDEVQDRSFLGYEVKPLEDVLQERAYDQIIICDFAKEEREHRLQAHGLSYGTDYVYEEDFFAELDDFQLPKDRKLVVWGTGHAAAYFAQWNQIYNIETYFDNFKSKESFGEVPVKAPEEVSDWKAYFIIIAVEKDDAIAAQLEALGLKRYQDYANYRAVMAQPSQMLRQTIFDQSYYDLDCSTMLNHLEILSKGNTCCCCTTFIDQLLDNALEKGADALWHSNRHKVMCLSTENRTFALCKKEMCPLFVAQERKTAQVRPEPYQTMTDRPKVLAIGHDSSCNLACITCRKEVCFPRGEELERIRRLTKIIKDDYLPACEFLILAGDGEVFASSNYREIYESETCNPQYIRLLSNGTLFTPKNWERFAAGKTGKIMLTVSVDAATKETYEKIRRNGNFDVLQENMEFAACLRKSGALSYFRMNFVVQRENYQEMIPFVQWGERLGVDEVFFTKILNWGTYTPEEFSKISLMEADGITAKPELKAILDHPVMKSKIVDLGTIRYTHKADEIDTVENYYKWELEKRGGRIFA